MEPRAVVCAECGARLRLGGSATATRFKCPKCNTVQPLPAAEPQAPPAPAPAPTVAQHGASQAAQEHIALRRALDAADKSARRPLRWAFLLTILPLTIYTFQSREDMDPEKVAAAFQAKLDARLAASPELHKQAEKLGTDKLSLELFALWAKAFEDETYQEAAEKLGPVLPKAPEGEQREVLAALFMSFMREHSGLVPPALLSKDTWAHWGLGALAAVAFLCYFCFAYPRGNARVVSLVKVGAFTGTIGIALLLAVQWLSGLATQVRLRGRGIVMLIWLILLAISFSYAAADDPENGFVLSFLGFTAGVGLLEELCKLLPVVWHYRHGGELCWRGACLWGLVSGAGFGIAEGIIYSTRYYNGSATAGIYVVRFVSCVAMHAAWAGAAAIVMFRRKDYLKGDMGWQDWLRAVAPALAIPMVLHGLYDTLLKMDMAGWALAVGAVSFAHFVYLQEFQARSEGQRAMALMARTA